MSATAHDHQTTGEQGGVQTPTGFPHGGIPTGWFQVAYSDALTVGDVQSLHYFGRDMVLYRGEDARPVLLDAHCLHMGAHLGEGGKVEGCDIVCPWHGWRWSADGANVEVPSEPGRPRRRRLGKWDVAESNGLVWAWHDEAGRPPQWPAPPDLTEGRDFLPVFPHCTHRWEQVRGNPQYVVENTADLDHFLWVHGNKSPLTLKRLEPDGPVMDLVLSWIAGYGKESTWLNEHGEVHIDVRTTIFGLGAIFGFFDTDNSILIQTQTPVDEGHFDIFTSVLAPQDRRVPGAGDVEPVGRALSRVREQISQAGKDVPIWNNLVYTAKAPYTRLESQGMLPLRKWCEQFFPRPYEHVTRDH